MAAGRFVTTRVLAHGPGLTEGSHLLEVEYVAADHGPFNPRVLAVTRFTVQR